MKKLLVVRSHEQVKIFQHVLGEEWFVVCRCGTVLGVHASVIILLPDWNGGLDDNTRRETMDWFDKALMTRKGRKDTPVIDLGNL